MRDRKNCLDQTVAAIGFHSSSGAILALFFPNLSLTWQGQCELACFSKCCREALTVFLWTRREVMLWHKKSLSSA
ncbi:MAG: hypothetical protein AAB699_00055 [Patescibacteria group bacterium]